MTFEEATRQVKARNHLLKYVHYDTLELVLMDLYIAYQDDAVEATVKRAYLKEQIQAIINSLIFPKSEDGENWSVENVADRHINEDIMVVLNYILNPENPRPPNIPLLFYKRLTSKGLDLSVSDFYRYR